MSGSGDMGGAKAFSNSPQETQLSAVQGLGTLGLDPQSDYSSAFAQLTNQPGVSPATPNSAAPTTSNISSIQSLMNQIMQLMGTPGTTGNTTVGAPTTFGVNLGG